MKEVKVAAIQPEFMSQNVEEMLNGREIRHAIELLEKASKVEANVVCFPEFYPLVGQSQISEKAADIGSYVIAGLLEETEGKKYNTATLIDPNGEIVGRQRKIHPVFLERQPQPFGIVPGEKYEVFRTSFGNIALILCFDFCLFLDWVNLLQQDLVLIFNPTLQGKSSLGGEFFLKQWRTAILSRAFETWIPIVGVNHAKSQSEGRKQGTFSPPFGEAGGSIIIQPPEITSAEEYYGSIRSSKTIESWISAELKEEEGILGASIDIEAVKRAQEIKEKVYGRYLRT